MAKAYFKKIYIFFLSLFLVWIFLFGQPIQLKYNIVTFGLIFSIFITSFLIKFPEKFSMLDIILFIHIFIITIGFNFYEYKTDALRHYFLNILPLFFLYFSLSNIERKHFFIITFLILSLSFIITLIGYFEIIFKKNIIYEYWISNPYYQRFIIQSPRIMSTQIHPTVFGSLLVGCLPFSYFVFERVEKYKIIYIFLIMFLVGGIIFSFSRGNLGGFIGSTILYLYLKKKAKYIKFIILSSIILIIISSIFIKNMLSFSRFSLDSIAFNWWKIELDNLNIAKKIIKQHPFIGIGFGNYRIKFEDYMTEKRKIMENYIKDKRHDPSEWRIPDNMYLSILTENGTLGFISFLLLLFILFKKVINILKKTDDLIQKDILIICISGVFGMFITMNTYDLFYWINPTLFLFFLISVIRNLIHGF